MLETQFTVFFEEVALVPEALIGQEGAGLRHVFAGLNPERVSAAAINNGIARFALEKGAAYATERVVWKTPIGAHQGVAHPLAKAYIAVQVHGGNGFAIEYGLADLWFIARLHKIAPVSREMILNYVAQHSLGLPKSY